MSLRVWLPLVGSLNNQGVDNVSFSYVNNNGKLSINSAGKLGSCYERTASGYADCYRSSSNYNLTDDLTMMCWAYVSSTIGDTANGLITNHNHSDCSGVGITVKQASTSDYRISCSTGSGSGTRTYCTYYGTTNIKNAWHHLALSYSKSSKILLLYVDGKVEYTLNNYSNYSANNPFDIFNWSTGYYTNGDFRPVCKLNDVRLYDVCLSAREIKEISKGIVIHHPLDGNGLGVPNLFNNSLSFTGWSAGSGWTKSTSDDGSDMYAFSRTGATGNNWVRLIPTLKVDGNNYPDGITVSFDLLTPDKSAINQKCLGSLQQYDSSGARTGWYEPGWDLTNVVNNKWSRVSFTFSKSALLTNSQGLVYSYTMFSFQLVQNGNIKIRKIKAEAGTKSTPYTLSLNDVGSLEIDASGYKHHGTRSGSMTYLTDSRRYSCCTNFVANSDTITLAPCFSTSQIMSELSVSIWFKTNTLNSTAPNWFSLGENSFFRARIAGNTSVWCYYRLSSASAVIGQKAYTFTCKTLTDNVWHNVVCTFKDGVSKCYIDGSLIGSVDESGTGKFLMCSNTGSTWHLAGYSANSENFIGSLSDFRLYTTALSEDDVKELYQNSASISNNGSLLCYELTEV